MFTTPPAHVNTEALPSSGDTVIHRFDQI